MLINFCGFEHFANTLSSLLLSLPCSDDRNLFLIPHPNGGIPAAVQDAPLALITKPRSQSTTPSSKPLPAATSPPYPIPINLKTGTEEMSGNFGFLLKSSDSSGVAHASRKTPRSLCTGKSLSKTNSSCPLVDLVRSSESDIHSSRESDDSSGDDHNDENNDDLEDEDSGSSLSG